MSFKVSLKYVIFILCDGSFCKSGEYDFDIKVQCMNCELIDELMS